MTSSFSNRHNVQSAPRAPHCPTHTALPPWSAKAHVHDARYYTIRLDDAEIRELAGSWPSNMCGNGIREAGEECDDGTARENSPSLGTRSIRRCGTDCTFPRIVASDLHPGEKPSVTHSKEVCRGKSSRAASADFCYPGFYNMWLDFDGTASADASLLRSMNCHGVPMSQGGCRQDWRPAMCGGATFAPLGDKVFFRASAGESLDCARHFSTASFSPRAGIGNSGASGTDRTDFGIRLLTDRRGDPARSLSPDPARHIVAMSIQVPAKADAASFLEFVSEHRGTSPSP